MRGVCIGIDPGRKGGCAIVIDDRIVARNLPYDGKVLDITDLRDWIERVRVYRPVKLVAIERQSAFRMGVASAMNYGRSLGRLDAMAALSGWPVFTPSAVAWQRAILGKSTKDKTVAIAHVKQRWPTVEWPAQKALLDGIGDAACLAEYAWRRMQ